VSGIFGIASTKRLSNPSLLVDRMAKEMSPPDPTVQFLWVSPSSKAALGVVHPERVGKLQRHWSTESLANTICVVDGVVNGDSTGEGQDPWPSHAGDLLLEHFVRFGAESLSALRGSFNVAFWNEEDGCLVLGNDRLSHRPLFYTVQGDVIAFASMLGAVVASRVRSPEVDVEGLADLLAFEYILGTKTLLKDFHVLPPASYLVFKDGKVVTRRYWHLDHVEPHGRYDRHRLDELVAVFRRAVRRCVPPHAITSIGLTGGIDSRCILAGAISQQLPVRAHTGSRPDKESTDVVLATEVARRAGVMHIVEPADSAGHPEWFVPMVERQSGLMATLDSHPCRAIFTPSEYDVSLSGIGGEFARCFWTFPPDLNLRDLTSVREAWQRWIFSKTMLRFEELWQTSYRPNVRDLVQNHLGALLKEYRLQNPPVAILEHLYLHERCRKYLNKSNLIVRASREVLFPYLDHEWVEAIAAIPIRERLRHRIQADLIRKLAPDLLDIPWAKNLIPLSTPLWRVRLIETQRKLRRRIRRVVGRRLQPILPRSSRKTRGQTVRRNSPFLRQFLLDPGSAYHDYLCGEVVEKMLDEHFSGRDSWDGLVSALTVFEIAHRLWIDPRPLAFDREATHPHDTQRNLLQ